MKSTLSAIQRDALQRQDAHYLPLPLPPAPSADQLMAHLRHTTRLLKDRQTSSPSARACAHVTALYERSVPPPAKAQVACRAGCSHCCRQPVLLYGPEAFFLAGHVRNRPELAARVAKAAIPARDIPLDALTGVECPVLEDHACSLYAARPLSCQAFVSLDVNACIATFRNQQPSQIQAPVPFGSMRDICRLILLASMQAAGLPLVAYELNTAVAAILKADNAEKRWLRGEDVLAGQERNSPLPPQSITAIDYWSAAVTATL